MPTKYKLKLPRDLNMLTMVGRKSGSFKAKREGRGGANNSDREYRQEWEDQKQEQRQKKGSGHE